MIVIQLDADHNLIVKYDDGSPGSTVEENRSLRRSREAAAETRRKIVKVAARQFRKHGIGGIGIADLMAKAGLTHGGFYKHFASKDVLAAEACAWALAATRSELASRAAAAAPGRGLEAIVDAYLSMTHRDQHERGCVIAALSAETARLGPLARGTMAEGYEALASLVAAHLKEPAKPETMQRARAIVSTMAGALAISRNLADREAAEKVLQAARAAALAQR